jgi:hypothetical protein
MARGWESKSVEEQQSQATTSKDESKKYRTPAEIAAQHRREALLLSRSRILQQLQATENLDYRKMLESALACLDRQLARPD